MLLERQVGLFERQPVASGCNQVVPLGQVVDVLLVGLGPFEIAKGLGAAPGTHQRAAQPTEKGWLIGVTFEGLS